MTQQRRDTHSTEFGIWLRKQPEIDSVSRGFVATNIDYVWRNHRTGSWMLIEEKRYNQLPKFYQTAAFGIIDSNCKQDDRYKGFHILVFENTSPEDGKIWLDHKLIDKMALIRFLQFLPLEEK